jgi:hypothetical protein
VPLAAAGAAVPVPVATVATVVGVVTVRSGQGLPDAVDRLVAVAQPELTEPFTATALPEDVESPEARPLPEQTESAVATQVPEATDPPEANAPPLFWLVVWAPAGPAIRARRPTTPARAISIDALSPLFVVVIVLPSFEWMSVGQSC